MISNWQLRQAVLDSASFGHIILFRSQMNIQKKKQDADCKIHPPMECKILGPIRRKNGFVIKDIIRTTGEI